MNEEEEIDPRQELKRAITNVREAAHKVTAFREAITIAICLSDKESEEMPYSLNDSEGALKIALAALSNLGVWLDQVQKKENRE